MKSLNYFIEKQKQKTEMLKSEMKIFNKSALYPF